MIPVDWLLWGDFYGLDDSFLSFHGCLDISVESEEQMSRLFLEGVTLIDASSIFHSYKVHVYFPCTACFSNRLTTAKFNSFHKILASQFFCLSFNEHTWSSQSEKIFFICFGRYCKCCQICTCSREGNR